MNFRKRNRVRVFLLAGIILLCSFFIPRSSVHASLLTDFSNQTASVFSSVIDFFSNIFSRKPPVNTAAVVAPVERTLTPTGPTGLDSLSNREGGTAPSTKVAVATTNTSTVTTKYLAVSAPPKVINTFTTQYVPTGVTREELNDKLAYLQNRLQEQFLSHNSHDSSTMGGGNVSGSLVSGEEGSFATLRSPDAHLTTLEASTLTVSGDSVFTGNSTFSSPLTLSSVDAPSTTTDKLYNLSDDLYWNGNLVSGAAVGVWTSTGGNAYRPTGNVGVGTTSPYAKLSVSGNGAFDGNVLASSFTATSTTATSTFAGGLSAASSLYVLQNGNVGIGTTNPGAKLDVNGDIFVETGNKLQFGNYWGVDKIIFRNDVTNKISLDNSGNTNWITSHNNWTLSDVGNVGIGTTSPSAKLSVTSSGTGTGRAFAIADSANAEKFIVLDNGNVGIGVTNPQIKLEVGGIARVNSTFYIGSNNQLNIDPATYSLNRSGFNSLVFGELLGGADTYSFTLNQNYSGATSDILRVQGDAGSTKLVVKNSGNVGIGTTNPGATLDVQGAADKVPLIVRADLNNIPTYTKNLMELYRGYYGGSTLSAYFNSTGGLFVGQNTTGALFLGDSSGSAATIEAQVSNLDLRASGKIIFRPSTGVVQIGTAGVGTNIVNLTGDTSTTYEVNAGRIVTDFADSNNSTYKGRLSLGVYDSGGTRTGLTIVSNGTDAYVGIGTTSPYAKLSVAGNGVFDGSITATNITATGTLSISGAARVDRLGVGVTPPGATQTAYIPTLYSDTIYPYTSHVINMGTSATLDTVAVLGRIGVGSPYSTQVSQFAVAGNAVIGDGYFLNSAPTNGLLVQGNVGIGTTTPSQALSVQGTSKFSPAAGETGITIQQATSQSANLFDVKDTAGASLVNIGASGIITAGTINASYLSGSAGGTFGGAVSLTSNSTLSSTFITTGANVSGTYNLAAISDYTGRTPLLARGISGQSADLFQVQNDTPTTLFNVTAAGNVGIGTTSPYAKLSVAGNAVVTGDTYLNNLIVGTNATAATTTIYGSVQINEALNQAVSFSIGNGNIASGDRAFAGGFTSTASANSSFAYGNTAVASGLYDFAAGNSVTASGNYGAFALGANGTASGDLSAVLGTYLTSSGNTSITIGKGVDDSNRLVNSASNSLYVGFNSTIPTLAVTAASGVGTIGSVGIGTTNPQATLDVHGEISQTGSSMHITTGGNFARLYMDPSGPESYAISANNDDSFGILGPAGWHLYTTSNGNMGLGTTSPASKLTVVGSACISGGVGATAACTTTAGHISAVSFDTASVDLAENYETTDSSITAGDIVAVDPDVDESVIKATPSLAKEGAGGVLGIVSTKPGMLLGANENNLNLRAVALAGRVPVKFSNENGEIKRGDNLTISSSTPGVAMKADSGDVVIGTALSEVKGDNTVMVFVRSNLSTFASNILNATSTPSIGDRVIDNTSIADTMIMAAQSTLQWIGQRVVAVTGIFEDLFAKRVHVEKGIEMKSPDGSLYCVTISNGGTLVNTPGSCDTGVAAALTSVVPSAAAITDSNPPVDVDTGTTTATTTSSNSSSVTITDADTDEISETASSTPEVIPEITPSTPETASSTSSQ